MARTSPWWRKVGMALAVLVLTVLTFGPSLDGLLCRDEGGIGALSGHSDSYFSRSKAKTFEAKLAIGTKIAAGLFVALSILLMIVR